jgi:hypothetical protein
MHLLPDRPLPRTLNSANRSEARDLQYLTAAEHTDLWNLADRALGATTKLHQYLQTCKGHSRHGDDRKGTQNPRTPNENEP